MARQRLTDDEGLTLLELTLAMSIFAIVLGVTAQGLISSYSSLKIQEQRAEAAHLCRSVLDHMREFRDENSETFPASLVGHWPSGTPIEDVATAPHTSLNEHQVNVAYGDPAANPLPVTVQAQWKDHQGRPVTFSVSTMLTDR